jgi:hypothetical protein
MMNLMGRGMQHHGGMQNMNGGHRGHGFGLMNLKAGDMLQENGANIDKILAGVNGITSSSITGVGNIVHGDVEATVNGLTSGITKGIMDIVNGSMGKMELNQKPTKKVMSASPGTKKVMEEISFEKPTWEDKDGMGWAQFPYGAGFGEEYGAYGAPFAAGPYGYDDFGYGGFEGYGAGFGPKFGYGSPYGGYGEEFGVYAEGPLGVWNGFDAAPFLTVPNYEWQK